MTAVHLQNVGKSNTELHFLISGPCKLSHQASKQVADRREADTRFGRRRQPSDWNSKLPCCFSSFPYVQCLSQTVRCLLAMAYALAQISRSKSYALQRAANESKASIEKALQGTDMVFVTVSALNYCCLFHQHSKSEVRTDQIMQKCM